MKIISKTIKLSFIASALAISALSLGGCSLGTENGQLCFTDATIPGGASICVQP